MLRHSHSPTIAVMRLFKEEGHAHSPRQSSSCVGWHCLSSATHFGIIFSIVVVFISLSMAWMYYMGRARIFRNQARLNNAPRRPRPRQHHRNLNGPARPVAYIVQQIPVLKYGVAQQAPIYFFSRPQALTAQPLGVMNAPVRLPAVALASPEVQQPTRPDDIIFESPQEREYHKEKSKPSDDASSLNRPTWWQRFYRAFNLPVGAASTVASSPSPEPPRPSPAASTNVRHPVSYPSPKGHAVDVIDSRIEAKDLEGSAKEQDETSSMECNLDNSSDSAQSIRSDVATVHSDDYEMPSR
ncbi:hypothetical protein V8C35DRAFT_293187 [Trichoderma chlorosporum]